MHYLIVILFYTIYIIKVQILYILRTVFKKLSQVQVQSPKES